MDVTFTKLRGRYEVRVDRTVGPALAPRNGPGWHDAVPHDVAHLISESEAGLRGAVFGRLAAADGDDGMFWPADPAARRKSLRNRRAPTPEESADMELSERLASLTVAFWEVARGRRTPDPAWPGSIEDSGVDRDLLDRIFARYDEFAARWEALPAGGSVTIPWPFPEGSGRRRRR
ncbi:hypothetical protein L615_001700000570 [Nocardioides sp. J9]|uniref:hypothetical protein n=1 Tax=Nocardioides sp. J9 TaxID=935844 RepID=UPI0011ACB80F|nr:hypothetical protein [Nocardioides sp. J9]TWH01652.1 hypothetical protein L615_001700000570 [Nocardioides sp. J9]